MKTCTLPGAAEMTDAALRFHWRLQPLRSDQWSNVRRKGGLRANAELPLRRPAAPFVQPVLRKFRHRSLRRYRTREPEQPENLPRLSLLQMLRPEQPENLPRLSLLRKLRRSRRRR
jgi:hypothetical protein